MGSDAASITVPHTPNNLPVKITSFVGRERAIVEITRLLAATRLLTLTGAGGCGKTRLALRVATDVLSAYPDGVWLVEFATLTEPELAPRAVASAIGVRGIAGSAITVSQGAAVA